jgi:hypothetical protein
MTSRPGNVPSPDSAREEAEQLVAAGLAAVSVAADRIGAPTRERGGAAAAGFDALGDMLFGPSDRRHTVANDSDACCRCPVCRLITAAREPDPAVAERIATGAGDIAEGAVKLLRALVGEGDPARPAERAEPTVDVPPEPTPDAPAPPTPDAPAPPTPDAPAPPAPDAPAPPAPDAPAATGDGGADDDPWAAATDPDTTR